MTSANLENLARIGQLKREPPVQAEGTLEVDDRLLAELISIAGKLESMVGKLRRLK